MSRATCRLPFGLAPHFAGSWNGVPHVVEEIAYHLYNDTHSLQQMALTSRVFTRAAQKALFKEFEVIDDATVYKWQIRILKFAAYQGPDAAPFFFRHVKKFSFALHYSFPGRTPYVVDFIHLIKRMLTGLESVHVYGGLDYLWPAHGWFSSFLDTTKPTVLSFNGTLVPAYSLLDNEFHSLRLIRFNTCRLYYCNEGTKPHGQRRPILNAELTLRQGGKKWERVKELISGEINCETLRLVKDATELDTLGLRIQLDVNIPLDIALSINVSRVRTLRLQVSVSSVTHIPNFTTRVTQKAPYLERIELFYEPGWADVLPWTDIVHGLLQAVFSALYYRPVYNVREILFRFQEPETMQPSRQILWDGAPGGIHVNARYDDEGPPWVPARLAFRFAAPFLFQEMEVSTIP